MAFAARTDHLQPEGAYQVLARAQALEAEGKDIIHLEIGEPDFPTLENVSQAGVGAIREGKTRYNPHAGLPRLREASAAEVERPARVSCFGCASRGQPGSKTQPDFPHPGIGEPWR